MEEKVLQIEVENQGEIKYEFLSCFTPWINSKLHLEKWQNSQKSIKRYLNKICLSTAISARKNTQQNLILVSIKARTNALQT